jgi:membrane protein YqaA with SNARE-associated domain
MDYLVVFTAAFLAATILPIASEVPFALLARTHENVGMLVAVATVGNFLGACTTYWVARATLPRLLAEAKPRTRHAITLVRRHGPPVLLLSWVPLIGDALVAVAGAAEVRAAPFAAWTLLGKALRYIVVAWIAVNA